MNYKTDDIDELRRRMHQVISYSMYLKLIGRCGVVFVPSYGWVAE